MIFYSLLTLVLLSPLPYATNRPWAWSLWAMIIALLAISWAIKILFFKSRIRTTMPSQSLSKLIICFFLVVSWAFIQTLTNIPADWIHPLWPIINDTLSTNVQGTISLNSGDTLTAIMRLISYALVFWLTLHYCHDRNKSRQVFFCLMMAGFSYSLVGLFFYLGQLDAIPWLNGGANKALSSTFANRNHFATYAGLTLLCTLALLSNGVQISNRYNLGGYLGFQRFLENLITRTWLPLLAFFVTGTALILTHSRGGFLSTLLGITVLLFAFNFNAQTRNIRFLSIVSVFLGIGGWIFFISGDVLTHRFERLEIDSAHRLEVYQLTWAAITDNPWLGYGYGCFQEAFALYKSTDIAGSLKRPLLWDYAHNTYLEIMFELGIPAALLLFTCYLNLIWGCLKGLMTRKRDLMFPAVGLSATALVGAHALVDFSIQIPAVAYSYALLMGATWAQSFSSRKKPQNESC